MRKQKIKVHYSPKQVLAKDSGGNFSKSPLKPKLLLENFIKEGLGESFERGIELMEHILANVKPDQKAYDDMVKGILKERADNKLDKSQILWGGLVNFGKYGQKSSFTNIISEADLKKIKPEELTNILKELCSYKHRMFYYGKLSPEQAKSTIAKYHKTDVDFKDYPSPVVYTEQVTDQSKVYFVNYDMVQANIVMIAKDELFNKALMPDASLFGEYFGRGLSSIVFQEIRESKALAYSAYAAFSIPARYDQSHWCYAFVATQADKLKIATDAMLGLMNNMPKAQKQFDASKEALQRVIESERITKGNIFWTYQGYLDKKIDYDIRKDIYENAKNTDIDKFADFFSKHISNKKYTFLIIGKRELIDFNVLKNIGPVEELSLEQIFGY